MIMLDEKEHALGTEVFPSASAIILEKKDREQWPAAVAVASDAGEEREMGDLRGGEVEDERAARVRA